MKRRTFLQNTGLAVAGGLIVPTIVPNTVFGKNAPSNRITIGMMGFGRQAYYSNTKPFLGYDDVVITAVCDADSWRMGKGKEMIEYDYDKQALTASSGTILTSVIKENEIRFPLKHEKRDFVDAIKTRGETLEDAEVGHRTCSMCQMAHISIQLGGKKLKWDPDKELFDLREANVLKRRPSWRAPWSLESFL